MGELRSRRRIAMLSMKTRRRREWRRWWSRKSKRRKKKTDTAIWTKTNIERLWWTRDAKTRRPRAAKRQEDLVRTGV
jgi:hypothetical protein